MSLKIRLFMLLIAAGLGSHEFASAQDTISFTYGEGFTFERGTPYCPSSPQFDEWTSYLDSLGVLHTSDTIRFVELIVSANNGVDSVEFTIDEASLAATAGSWGLLPFDSIIGLMVDQTSATNSPPLNANDGSNFFRIQTSACVIGGTPAPGCAALPYRTPAIDILSSTGPAGCNPSSVMAIRPHVRTSGWGGAFGATAPQSVSTSGLNERLTVTVRYVDIEPPHALCFDTLQVFLSDTGAQCTAVMLAADLDSASFDEFYQTLMDGPDSALLSGLGISDLGIDTTRYKINDVLDSIVYNRDSIGFTVVELTVFDGAGNSDSCMVTVHIIDTIAPTAVVKDSVILFLGDNSSTDTLSFNDINDGSYDNCTAVLDSFTIVDSFYTCATGVFGIAPADWDSLRLILVDTNVPDMLVLQNGDTIMPRNADTAYALVFVADSIRPQIVAKKDTLYLDSLGFVSLTNADSLYYMDADSTFDNDSCHDLSVYASFTQYPGSDSSIYDLSIYGPSNPFDTTLLTRLDSCGSPTMLDTVTKAGTTLPLWVFVQDFSGNWNSDSSCVVVLDTIAPIANTIAMDTFHVDSNGFYAILDSSIFDNGSTDNMICGIDTFLISMDTFEVCTDAMKMTYDIANKVLAVDTIYTTVIDASGNQSDSSIDSTIVVWIDTIAPTFATVTDTFVYLDSVGMASIDSSFILDGLASDSSSCNAGITYMLDTMAFDCPDSTTIPVTIYVADTFGNTDSAIVMVEIRDTFPPTAIAQNSTVYLDSNGLAILDSAYLADFVDNGSTDNCPSDLIFSVSDSVLTCDQEGLNVLTFFVEDIFGNRDSVDFFVTVDDTIAPTALPVAVWEVALNENGSVTIDPYEVDSNSYDNCPDNWIFELSQYVFDCDDRGDNSIDYIVKDGNGQSDTATFIVRIVDATVPVVRAQNISVTLDANGEAPVTAAMIDNGSTDNCGIDSIWINLDTVRCTASGLVPVTLTVRDSSGNQASQNAMITVVDNISPTLALFSNLDVFLSGAGNYFLSNYNLLDSATSDNCSFVLDVIGNVQFDCSHVGPQSVLVTATDPAGNISFQSVTVNVRDTVTPTAIAVSSFEVELNENGVGTITPSDLDSGSYAGCNGYSLSVSQSTFNCADIALSPLNVNFTVTNASNTTTEVVVVPVTVVDRRAPVIVTAPDTLYLDASGMATTTASALNNGTTDNCNANAISISQTSFDCSNLGSNTIMFTAVDARGNTATSPENVVVLDTIAPTVTANATTTLSLDQSGASALTASDLNLVMDDNCSVSSFSVSQTAFTCADLGSNAVVITAIDPAGNTTSLTVNVVVEDNLAPNVIALDTFHVDLDASGFASFEPMDLITTLYDNCVPASQLDVRFGGGFDGTVGCSDLATGVLVTVQVDENPSALIADNPTSRNIVVIVHDVTAPVITANSPTVYLSNAGSASLTLADYGTATDVCDASPVLVASDLTFDCNDVGMNTETLTATDASGNSSTEIVTVNVLDTVSPTVSTLAFYNVTLNSAGNATIMASDIITATFDACGAVSESIDIDFFDCSNMGDTVMVTATVTDNSGNTASSVTGVIISDMTNPNLSMVDSITVNLDGDGMASINAAMVDLGSTDNCGNALMGTLSQTNFDCSDIGANNIGYTIEDDNGNQANGVVVVTVKDISAPFLATQNLTLYLNTNGTAVVPSISSLIDSLSDNCDAAISRSVIGTTSFDCSHVGANAVQVEVEDNFGNITVGQALITVIDSLGPRFTGITTLDTTIAICNAAGFTFDEPTLTSGVTDNCGVAMINTDGPYSSGSTFPLGTTTIVYTAVDVNNNTSTNTFVANITVIDVNEVPTFDFETTVCEGSALIDLVGTNSNLTWSGPFVDATGSLFDPQEAGSYTLNYDFINSIGCLVEGTVVIVVNPAPNAPVISQTATNALMADGGFAMYQWFLDGMPIAGVTGNTLYLSTSGTYHAMAMSEDGCPSAMSNAIVLGASGGSNKINLLDLTMYPNPSSGIVNLEFNASVEDVKVTVYNAAGTRVMFEEFSGVESTTVQLDANHLESAMYMVVVQKGSEVFRKKLVITK